MVCIFSTQLLLEVMCLQKISLLTEPGLKYNVIHNMYYQSLRSICSFDS